MKTPFAFVTFFKSNETIHLTGPMNYTQLDSYLDSYIPSINGIYAIKIHGTFNYIKARSPTAQKQPYPPLQEALKNQSVFIFHNITGTGVGFRFPTYMADINAVGYHFHFIDDGRSAGGHMLECTIQNASVEIDYISQFHMLVPNDNASSLVSP